MIYQELVDNEYVYKVTDSKGYLIAETYSRTAAEQLEAQYRLHIHTRDYNEHKSLYKGILPQL